MNGGMQQLILMERIEGTRLDKLWPSFSPLQRFLTAWTLRGYILELRKASGNYHRRHIPGPMADTPQPCHGAMALFQDREQGPFERTRQLLDYFSKWSNDAPPFDSSYDSQPLVLTHGDLSMRNIIVGRDGIIWLIDWELAGFYPPFCESIATKSAACQDDAPSS
jgi:aminoglycoside phosphotransferase (APT) family kinase protein